MEDLIKQLDVFFNPKSVAIVGATKKINKAGHVILKISFKTRREAFSKEKFTLLTLMKVPY